MSYIIVGFILVLVVIPAIALLPAITIDVTAVTTSSFYAYIRAGLYFLPCGTVVTILSIIMALWIFRIIVAVIKAFWEILPFA